MQKLETEAAEVTIRPDGIVEFHMKPTWDKPDTAENAKENALMLKKAIDGKRRAILSFPPNLYVKKELVEAYKTVEIGQFAEALVVNSFGARILCNVVLKLTKNAYPIRIFNSKNEAEAWLLQLLKTK
jgi:hypothetical protein